MKSNRHYELKLNYDIFFSSPQSSHWRIDILRYCFSNIDTMNTLFQLSFANTLERGVKTHIASKNANSLTLVLA